MLEIENITKPTWIFLTGKSLKSFKCFWTTVKSKFVHCTQFFYFLFMTQYAVIK